jgi:hypothetical protein
VTAASPALVDGDASDPRSRTAERPAGTAATPPTAERGRAWMSKRHDRAPWWGRRSPDRPGLQPVPRREGAARRRQAAGRRRSSSRPATSAKAGPRCSGDAKRTACPAWLTSARCDQGEGEPGTKTAAHPSAMMTADRSEVSAHPRSCPGDEATHAGKPGSLIHRERPMCQATGPKARANAGAAGPRGPRDDRPTAASGGSERRGGGAVSRRVEQISRRRPRESAPWTFEIRG